MVSALVPQSFTVKPWDYHGTRRPQVTARASSSSQDTKVELYGAKRALWFPGRDPAPWLKGELPGDFGFDPWKLGETEDNLKWYAQAELQHARWAMLGMGGIMFTDFMNHNGWNLPNWYDAGKAEYPINVLSLLLIQFAAMNWAEVRRWQDFNNPGSVSQDPFFKDNPKYSCPGKDVGYPGGNWFDPLGLAKDGPESPRVKELRVKEIKNGRLAMLAFMGCAFQHFITGKSPLDNLYDHIADPGHHNWFDNDNALEELFNSTFQQALRDQIASK